MSNGAVINQVVSSLDLNLIITDRNTLGYLAQFPDEETQIEKAIEALKVGVVAIQSASPTLDTTVVQSHFSEMETRMRESISEFQRSVKDDLKEYFEDNNGIVPRSIDGVFGSEGVLARTFQTFFDPEDGKLSRLMKSQVGPDSTFGKSLDPGNKQGVIAVLEARVQELIEAKLDEVLKEFSLDENGSAMCRLQTLLAESFEKINKSLGIKVATAEEAQKGHVKGIEFEKDLYPSFAEMGRQLGDDTDLVGGIVGVVSRCKKGDYVVTLGESSGAPGTNIVVEIKNQPLKIKEAIDELQEAKANREATVGIFVFARGCEPPEVGDFRRIGEDFYCTVDKNDLHDGKSLLFFESAYKIARALIVATTRKESAGELDIQKIEDHLDALAAWSDRIADMAKKARTIQNSGKLIEECANDLKDEMDRRVAEILVLLRVSAAE